MDTWMGKPYYPSSLNKYLYAEANPVMYVDPSGHFIGLGSVTTTNLVSVSRAYHFASFAFDVTAGFASGGSAGAAKAVAEEVVFGKLSRMGAVGKMSDQMLGFFSKVWSRGVKLRLGKPYSSRHLEHNMKEIFGGFPAGHTAHHIVPKTSPAMAVLRKHNIDPNSVSNGVALPRKSGTGSMSATHRGRHCKPYYQYVNRLIGGAKSKQDVLNVLQLIRVELLTDSVQLHGCT